jgi:hypothetical protein
MADDDGSHCLAPIAGHIYVHVATSNVQRTGSACMPRWPPGAPRRIDGPEQADQQMDKLGPERTALKRAHCDGAVPTDILKTEMNRLTRAVSAPQRQVEATNRHLTTSRACATSRSSSLRSAPGITPETGPLTATDQQCLVHKLWTAQRRQRSAPFNQQLERRRSVRAVRARAAVRTPSRRVG